MLARFALSGSGSHFPLKNPRSVNAPIVIGRSEEPTYDTIRYAVLFNVRSKADTSQLNLPRGNDNKKCKTEKLKSENGYAQK